MLTNKDMSTITRQRAAFNDALAMFVGAHATHDLVSAERHRQMAVESGVALLETLDNLNPQQEAR